MSLWIDLHPENIPHNQAKLAALVGLVGAERDGQHGMAFANRMLLTNDAAGFGTEPDAMFVSRQTFEAGKVRFAGEGDSELVGSPDIVVEVVSDSTEEKDTDWLRTAYHLAGVAEYWLIDARGRNVRFEVFVFGTEDYAPAKARKSWQYSPVFAAWVRLARNKGRFGMWKHKLEIRETAP